LACEEPSDRYANINAALLLWRRLTMLCETCRWSGRPGFVRVAQNVQQGDQCELIPCPDTGGNGCVRIPAPSETPARSSAGREEI
jgi:hypothetical protein